VPVPPAGRPWNDVFSGGAIVNCIEPAAGATSPARRSATSAVVAAPSLLDVLARLKALDEEFPPVSRPRAEPLEF
jgi:hypothetical protein